MDWNWIAIGPKTDPISSAIAAQSKWNWTAIGAESQRPFGSLEVKRPDRFDWSRSDRYYL